MCGQHTSGKVDDAKFMQGRIQRGQLTLLQSHIREVKRMMYKYKNTLKCTIS